MLDSRENKYLITSLIDGELTDESMIREIKALIESDPELKKEYELHRFIKSLVHNNCKFRSSPEKLKRKILRKIKWIGNPLPQPFQFLRDIFSQPSIAVSGAFALILIVVTLLVNQTSKNKFLDLASEQLGSENMFVQAAANFENILCGKLSPQILTDSPETIKKFFIANGVKYATLIPQIENWKLIGGVVSEAHGEKLAHHVYTNSKGQIIYLFQVDKSCLKKNKSIKLSQNLLSYLDEGKCYCSTKNNCTTLMKKIDDNICAIVSDIPQNEIENLLCSLQLK